MGRNCVKRSARECLTPHLSHNIELSLGVMLSHNFRSAEVSSVDQSSAATAFKRCAFVGPDKLIMMPHVASTAEAKRVATGEAR